MRSLFLRPGFAWACTLATVLGAGCSENSASDAALREDPAESPSPGASILYVGESPVTLSPGERASLPFAVRPRGPHQVRFALVGDSGDAALDVGTATSDAHGSVSVVLTAPSTSRTFTVRATLPLGAAAEAPISVSGIGFGNIEVVPSYSGKRRLARIVGSVATGTSCAELAGFPPPDGPLVAQAVHPRSPVVEGAPVGPSLVVTARAGYFAGGCMDVKGLRAGETKSVVVPLLDRPLELVDPLGVSFGLDTSEAGVLAWLETSGERAAAAFAGSSDAASLLDAMEDALAPAHRSAFAELRQQEDWDAKLADHFAASSVSLEALGAKLLVEGAGSLKLSAGLAGQVERSADAVAFRAQSIFEVPIEAPTSNPIPLTFSATADDVVHLGGELAFAPLALLATAALAPAQDRVPSATTVADALAELVGCETLVEVLSSESSASLDCGPECLVQACIDGLDARWKAALHDEELARWKLTASGEAKVGNEAELIGIEGSWVGTIEHAADSIAVKGSTHGAL